MDEDEAFARQLQEQDAAQLAEENARDERLARELQAQLSREQTPGSRLNLRAGKGVRRLLSITVTHSFYLAIDKDPVVSR